MRILLGSSYKPPLVAKHVISMSSTSLAGCFASLLVVRMWASRFTTSRVLFAKSLLSISFFGVGPNWRRDHALWCLEQEAEWTLVGSKSKKSFADVVRSSSPKLGSHPSPVRKKPMFLRLNYPRNYHLNFKENLVVPPKSPASDPRVISMAKSNVHASERVLR